jgi:hypothetical protein
MVGKNITEIFHQRNRRKSLDSEAHSSYRIDTSLIESPRLWPRGDPGAGTLRSVAS